MNPMRNIRIEKLTLNIGCGESGDKVDKAKKLLESLTEKKKVVITKTHDRTSFGMATGRPIGCKVTLRGKTADEFLKRALATVDFKIQKRSFDKQGSFSFGIKEHIDMPGVRYDPEIGIFGMDVCITLERPGFRIKRKKIHTKIGKKHLLNPEESMEWLAKNYKVEII
ncbi:MAG: 50S ribosomal protein L5 [Candidatus Aenigmatarchaeota archaeon]